MVSENARYGSNPFSFALQKSPEWFQNDASSVSGNQEKGNTDCYYTDGATVRIICGEMNGVKGPVQNIMIDPEYIDVELPAGKSFTHIIKENHTVFAYVIDGEAYFDHIRKPFAHNASGVNYFDMKSPCPCRDGTLVLYKKTAPIFL